MIAAADAALLSAENRKTKEAQRLDQERWISSVYLNSLLAFIETRINRAVEEGYDHLDLSWRIVCEVVSPEHKVDLLTSKTVRDDMAVDLEFYGYRVEWWFSGEAGARHRRLKVTWGEEK